MLIHFIWTLAICGSLVSTMPQESHEHCHHSTSFFSNAPSSLMTYNSFLGNFTPSSPLILDPPDDMITFFQNLAAYSPANSSGSCGYVSLIQYLCYLDSFYNDGIIPQAYEQNQGSATSLFNARLVSPGVLNHAYPSYNDITEYINGQWQYTFYDTQGHTDFYNYVIANKSTDYQMKLMHIFNEANNRAAYEYSASIGMWSYDTIFSTISALSGVSFSYVKASNTWPNTAPNDSTIQQYFYAYVTAQLALGRPVILHIAKAASLPENQGTDYYSDYHSVVAYYYDDDGIHANFGWGSNTTDLLITGDDGSYYITDAGYLDVSSIPIRHSDNFIVDNHGYCGCGTIHTHHYTFKYQQISLFSPNHKSYCVCDSYITETHTVSPESIFSINGHQYGSCAYCNASVDLGTGSIIIPITPTNDPGEEPPEGEGDTLVI